MDGVGIFECLRFRGIAVAGRVFFSGRVGGYIDIGLEKKLEQQPGSVLITSRERSLFFFTYEKVSQLVDRSNNNLVYKF